MRVLLLNDYGTPTGGAELVVLGLRDEFRRRGHDARLLASTAHPHGGTSVADYSCFGLAGKARGVTQVWNPSARRRLRTILREFDPDVVHVRLFLSQLSPAILPLLADRPAIFHAAWYRSVCPLGTKLLPDGTICNDPAGVACLRHRCVPPYAAPTVLAQTTLWRRQRGVFDAVVANSEATRRRLTEAGIAVTHTIWNGVADLGERAPLDGRPTVIFAGRLVREKGVDVLVEAFQAVVDRVPSARLVVFGEGPERRLLEQRTAELALRDAVTFAGFVARAELERAARSAWVQVVPSRWDEPFGNVAAESLMRGTPVVVSGSGGMAEFVNDGETGRHVTPGDATMLASAIATLLEDREANEAMGRNARSFALSHLGFATFADRFLTLYGSLRA